MSLRKRMKRTRITLDTLVAGTIFGVGAMINHKFFNNSPAGYSLITALVIPATLFVDGVIKEAYQLLGKYGYYDKSTRVYERDNKGKVIRILKGKDTGIKIYEPYL